MLYDMRIHLPQLMEKMLIEDFRAGDINNLEQDKIIIEKLLKETDLEKKLKLADIEKENQKKSNDSKLLESIKKATEIKDIMEVLVEIEKAKNIWAEKTTSIEHDYWETVIAQIKNTVDSIQMKPESE